MENPQKTTVLSFSALGFLQMAQGLVLWGQNIDRRKPREWGGCPQSSDTLLGPAEGLGCCPQPQSRGL